MKRLPTLLSALLAISTVSVAEPASARPTLWQRADQPGLAHSDRAWRRVSRYLDSVETADHPEMRHDFWLGALLMAEQYGVAALPDPALRLVFAQTLLGSELGREVEAAALARGVLAEDGPDSAWLEAEARMILAEAATDPETAMREVGRALPLVWDSRARSDLFRRRADAKMAAYDVRGSLSDYRAALEADDSARRSALARFGLGLALERSGNLPQALAELRVARLAAPRLFGVELGVLTLPGVFAFRSYDVHYVVALSERSLIPNPADPEAEAAACERALSAFREYLAESPPSDRFRDRAERHLTEFSRECRALHTRPPGRAQD
jgi:hypothetical protein